MKNVFGVIIILDLSVCAVAVEPPRAHRRIAVRVTLLDSICQRSALGLDTESPVETAPVVPPRATGAPPPLLGRTLPPPLLPSRRRRRAPPGKARAVPAAAALASPRARRAWRGSSSLGAVRLGGSSAGDGGPSRCSVALALVEKRSLVPVGKGL
jgi:hypothetical protein